MNLMSPEIAAIVSASLLLALALLWWRHRAAAPRAPEMPSQFDTVQAWPPQAVRVMTLGERQAFEILKRALPGHVVLAQVPLSRFISVPTRHPYNLWLQRAGRLAVDLLVCDYSSRAIAAVEVRTAEESARAAKRHHRLAEVLRAAGVVVHEWDEDNLPSIAEARDLFTAPRGGIATREASVDATGRRLIPVAEIAEILAEGDATDYGQLEPVPSGFYEDGDLAQVRRAA
ncbi:MAG TPA: DUF2726 domain-containing protein [Burkholderiaceae bacterium]|nr:DUF2726 domain-containing protein [Burkholderiaceae bacterium]